MNALVRVLANRRADQLKYLTAGLARRRVVRSSHRCRFLRRRRRVARSEFAFGTVCVRKNGLAGALAATRQRCFSAPAKKNTENGRKR